MMSACGLCQRDVALRNSHVLPAFVTRWLRETSATGHIRYTDNINKRVQDGIKKPWLCGDCEGLLSRDETAFATQLFHPWMKRPQRIEYGEWLMRFCTSVSWRVLNHCKGQNPDHEYTVQEELAAEQANVSWRSLLLGTRQGITRFEQHLIPWGILKETTIPDLPDNMNRYLNRAIEMDIVGNSKMLMTYAKLGPFMIFGFIRHGKIPWEGTKVFGQHGYFEPRKIVLPAELIGFFNDRARMIRTAQDSMSPAQRAKTEVALIENIERARKSDQLRSMIADAQMFGDKAVLWMDS